MFNRVYCLFVVGSHMYFKGWMLSMSTDKLSSNCMLNKVLC